MELAPFQYKYKEGDRGSFGGVRAFLKFSFQYKYREGDGGEFWWHEVGAFIKFFF